MHIKKTKNIPLIMLMQKQIFPADELVSDPSIVWFICSDGSMPVGFAGLEIESGINQGCGFLVRCGVLDGGRGIQRKLIRAREHEAIRRNIKMLYTYTTRDNYGSLASLIKSGYKIYDPAEPWGCEQAIYFQKRLTLSSEV